MKPYFSQALTAIAVALPMALLAVHQARHAQRIAVIDLAALVRAQEAKFNEAATRVQSDQDRQALVQAASAAGNDFARKLPGALADLQRDCACTILDRSAVLAERAEVADLTAQLRAKLGL
ncbi:hypothetical protein [Massilia sp. TS11]|uniref:hypothetical protein n=1 Tax=Massilia sp. TS11 TaxID=2908003 RepID=UPI001EDA2C27|nr:hypothetical protein [Massilia sp. TS11]MCG2583886.1 hypothetical protein [Massilia sp. TS11]